MSGITSSTAELVKKAVWYMQKHPTLTTALAMQLAGFSEEDYANSSKQRMVRRHLPGKGKRKMKELLSSDSSGTLNGTTVPREVVVDCSPVTDPTTTDESFFTATEPESPPNKMNRCNSKQMQDKRRKELKRREKRKAAHKSGTTLYADQLSLGPDGMSVRQCAESNKKRNGGIGPSPSALHHYVVKLGKIGTSPLKKMAIDERALHLWNNTKEGSKLRVKDVEDLLAWHKVKKVGDMSKDEKFKAWEEIARKGTVPPKCDRWTDEDEMALIESARMDLGVADTALGRLRARKKADFVRTARKFTPEEWDAMCAARNLDMAADQVDNDANVGGKVGDDVGNEGR